MKPRRRHVYAPRGFDPDYEAVRGSSAKMAGTPMGEVCPHGGRYFKGVPMCGTCLNDGTHSDVEQTLALLKQLDDICKMVAFRSKHRAHELVLSAADRKNICFMAIWKNLLIISKTSTRSPLALAYSIADRALGNEEKKAVYRRNIQPEIGKDSEGEQQEQDSDGKLEKLALREDENFREESVLIFPDAKLVWNLRTSKIFLQLAEEAMKKLPSWPFSTAEAIKWRCGFYGGDEIPWSNITQHFNDPACGRLVTDRQVSYAVTKGILIIKNYIMERLTPDLGEALKKLSS